MPWPSRLARSRDRIGRLRCEPLEGRVLLAASIDYPRLALAMKAAWEAPPLGTLGLPSRSLDLDLDGDGLLDRAELWRPPGSNTDRLDVFRGLEKGGLEPARQVALGYVAMSVLANDFDGDGHLDLFAVGEAPGEGTLLLNDGGWSFQVCQRPAGGTSLAVGDLTGDGRDDFVFADPTLDRVIVDVTGLSRTIMADANAGVLAPEGVHLADLDGDGLLDLLVCTGAAGLLVYPGLGGGQFGPEVGTELGLAGDGPARVTVAYLNDRTEFRPNTGEEYDPYPDLIVTNVSDGTLSVFLGEGGWRMRRLEALRAGPAPSSVLPRDVNGDGLPDLVVTSRGSDSVWILPGLGGGRFDDSSPRVLPVGHLPLVSFVADFDGDSRLDLAVVNAGSDDVTFYPDIASDATAAVWVASGGAGPVAAIHGDVNADGFADLVVAHRDDGVLALLMGGEQGLSLRETVAMPGGDRPTALAPSTEPWKVYVATEGGEEAALVSFTPSEEGPPLIDPDPTGEDPPTLDPPSPETQARLESPFPGAVGLFPTLVTPLYDDEGDPSAEAEEDETAESSGKAKAASINLPGGSGETEELGEVEFVEAAAEVTTEQSVQRFLLGADEAPPPVVAADGSTETARAGEELAPPTPVAQAEDEPEPPATTEEEPAVADIVAPPPDEDAAVEAVLLLVALAVARDAPVTGRRGDRAAW